MADSNENKIDLKQRYDTIYNLNVQPYKNSDEAFEAILKAVARILGLQFTAITRVDDKYEYTLMFYNGEKISKKAPKLPLNRTFCDTVCNGGGNLVINDTREIDKFKEHYATRRRGITSYIGVPLRLNDGSIYGTLCGFDENPKAMGEDELALLEVIARRVVYDIEMQQQNQQLKDALDNLEKVNNQIKSEMLVAQQIQEQLLPLVPPEVEGIKLVSEYRALEEVGGDFIDYFVDDDIVSIFVGDASGHGVPAALVACMSKIALENHRIDTRKPGKLLTKLHHNIYNKTNNHFVTACSAVLDRNSRTLTYSLAGHPRPYLIKSSGEVTQLEGRGAALGLKENPQYEENSIVLSAGDQVLFVTDGVIECRNQQNHELDPDQIEKRIQRLVKTDRSNITSDLLKDLNDFMGQEQFEDDVTLVLLTVT